ncbi:MAG: rhomboid family intramembrane serine protease [Bacteroidales bacterium]|nr:rhomboid family intramembrane serine protease [Bacteroidales bacterium]
MLYLIIGITVLISILSFSRPDVFDKLKFNAWYIRHESEWFRFFSYGLVHADWMHLFINMFVLYSFGDIVVQFFEHYFGNKSILYFILLYVGGIGFSSLYDFGKHKENIYYNAVGASGAVSAVVFSSIILYPAGKIFLFFIPIGIPAPVFGILYLAYSAYMAKRGSDNIGHSAHFWGAVYGIAFTIAVNPEFAIIFINHLFG